MVKVAEAATVMVPVELNSILKIEMDDVLHVHEFTRVYSVRALDAKVVSSHGLQTLVSLRIIRGRWLQKERNKKAKKDRLQVSLLDILVQQKDSSVS